MRAAHALAPETYESLAARLTGGMFTDEDAPVTDGNLFEPMAGTDTRRGAWKEGKPLRTTGSR